MAADFVDHRKIATELSQRAIDRIITIGEAKLKEHWARYKNRDVSTYTDYLVRKGVQASKVRISFTTFEVHPWMTYMYLPRYTSTSVDTQEQLHIAETTFFAGCVNQSQIKTNG